MSEWLNGRIHRFGDGNYEASAGLLASHVRGSELAISQTQVAPGRYFQRPDASHLTFDPTRTSLDGTAGSARVARIGGGPWRWSVDAGWLSPGVELNDVGFQQGADQLSQGASVGYHRFRPAGAFPRWGVQASQASRWSSGGEHTFGLVQLFGYGQHRATGWVGLR